MPQNQIATTGNYDFGAPRTAGEVLRFTTKKNQGGKLVLLFECPAGAANDLTVSLQVAPAAADPPSAGDAFVPDTFVATTAANNLTAVTNLTVAKGTSREATVLIRPGIDQFVRLVASGGTRGIMQVRGDDILEPAWTDQFATPPAPIH